MKLKTIVSTLGRRKYYSILTVVCLINFDPYIVKIKSFASSVHRVVQSLAQKLEILKREC